MELRQALRVSKAAKIAFVGAGGKTTAVFQLARQLEPPVVVTTTTHLGDWQTGLADRHLVVTRGADIAGFASQIEGVTLLTGAAAGEHRVSGLNVEALAQLEQISSELGFPVLIEADGSRQKPLKAPGAHEPAIPAWVTQAVVVAGMSGVGKALNEHTVHRPEEFRRISGLALEEPITLEGLMRVLTHAEGGLKGIPAGARRALILNQVEREEDCCAILGAARQLTPFYSAITLCALEEKKIWANLEAAAAIILAAGGASRYGQPKLLLEWRGKPLVRHVVESALSVGLQQVLVVLGAEDAPIRAALHGLPVTFVTNSRWQEGQSTSVKAGIAALDDTIGAALFLLADQPKVPAALIQALVEQHRRHQQRILATSSGGRRGNPVLFDRSTFADFNQIQGDLGGRALFERYPPQLLEWADPAVLADVDTPEDFARLKGEG
jgi:molybdenum cofactor cytidylyltransferase